MYYRFIPHIRTLHQMEGILSTDDIKYETMFFSSSPKFIKQREAPLTHKIITELEKHVSLPDDSVIDTRVTMTMKGVYPSIPGWHCDDVPRGEKYAQPDVNQISPEVQHYMILLSDTHSQSCTEFVSEPFECQLDPQNVWHSLHNEVENKKPRTRFIKPGELIQFDQNSIHRASATQNPGWRFFFRLSVTHRKIVNEIRKQVQVYAPANGGW